MVRKAIIIYCRIALLIIAMTGMCAAAQESPQPARILILLDGSSSMLQPWNNDQNRFRKAGSIIMRLIDSIYRQDYTAEFGLRVYGHQSPAQDKNCYDTNLEVMFSRENSTQMSLRLDNLQPAGVSPIAFSLQQAAEHDLLNAGKYKYAIILITDGGESCNGNICNAAQTLREKGISFKPFIIGLVAEPSLKSNYSCLGSYLPVTTAAEETSAIETIVEEYKKENIVNEAAPIQATITPEFTVARKSQVAEISKLPSRNRMPQTEARIPSSYAKVPAKAPIINSDTGTSITLSSSANISTPARQAKPTEETRKLTTIPVQTLKAEVHQPAYTEIQVVTPTVETDTGTGMVYITNTNNIGQITVYHQRGGKDTDNQAFNISGKKALQKHELPVGDYKIIYYASGQTKTIRFKILNRMVTEVLLD